MVVTPSSDTAFVLGLFLVVLSIPSMVSALIDGRTPRLAVLVFLLGGTALGYALVMRPGGYAFEDIPHVIVRVIARFMG